MAQTLSNFFMIVMWFIVGYTVLSLYT